MSNDQFAKTIEDRDKIAEYNRLPVVDYATLLATVDKWLLIKDPGLIKLLHASLIANKIQSDPVWIFLLAASGGGKTEIMNGFLKCPDYYSLSQLTPNTFLSGFKAGKNEDGTTKEASLLKRLGSGKTIGFKDFTSLLDGNKDELKELMGQFRDLYDGHVTKVTGTGEEITWKGKMGFIAGCTPIIEQRMSMVGAMGERFLNYKMISPTRKAMREKMRSNIGHEREMRDEIQNVFAGYQKGIVIPDVLPTIPEEVDRMIESMTDFIAISRAVIMRGMDTKREIEYIVEPEMSSRTYKQLYTLGMALMIMNGGTWTEIDTYILRHLAISSIHSMRLNLIMHALKFKTQVKTQTFATELGYPTSTTRRYLEDLTAISMDGGRVKILKRVYQGKGKPDLWEITPEMREILGTMGINVEATREDTGFQETEEDRPIGDSLEAIQDAELRAEQEAYSSGTLL